MTDLSKVCVCGHFAFVHSAQGACKAKVCKCEAFKDDGKSKP